MYCLLCAFGAARNFLIAAIDSGQTRLDSGGSKSNGDGAHAESAIDAKPAMMSEMGNDRMDSARLEKSRSAHAEHWV